MSVQTGGKRMVIRGVRPRFFKDKRTAAYYSAGITLASKFAPDEPISGPISITVVFSLARPKSLKKTCPHIKRPDLDNLEKGLLDILTQAGFWNDDSQITQKHTHKIYVAPGEDPFITVGIREVQ